MPTTTRARRRSRPSPAPVLSNATLERMLHWVAAEVRAEQRFGWYASRRPALFIRGCPPSEN